MRLLDTTTLEFKEVEHGSHPDYAILSHRWGSIDDELTYKDYKKGLKRDAPGYKKIEKFCERARCDDLKYGWIDTCCIDKRSSAELSEAINSMFAWYRDSRVCYAFLDDVCAEKHWQDSIWWSRGWTLQELIAPQDVVFHDRDWNVLGTKGQLCRAVQWVTGIPHRVLTVPNSYRHFTVAQKLSWAAGRQTSRTEDRAYSLLGIFNINMPLLYGEREKAFTRLQLEILQKYGDESIYAWQSESRAPHSVLAESPNSFMDCGRMAPSAGSCIHSNTPRRDNPARVTSWGVELIADAVQLRLDEPMRVEGHIRQVLWAVTLTTFWGGSLRALPCTILLVQVGPATYMYKRLYCFHGPVRPALDEGGIKCSLGNTERNMRFYLQFDRDFFYSY